VAEIAAASREQSSGIEQVNKAVVQLDEMTQQNAALVEQASAASQSMADQARELNESMQRYHVNETQDDAAEAAPVAPAAVERRKASRPWTQPAAKAAAAPRAVASPRAAATPSAASAPVAGNGDTVWNEF